MPLQSSGQISLLNIADEFQRSRTVISLSDFYKKGWLVSRTLYVGNNGVVKSTSKNSNIPTSGTIAVSNFYGASDYWLRVKFNVTSETFAEYYASNNGTIKISIQGVSNNYKLSCTGKTAVNLYSNTSHTFTGLHGGPPDEKNWDARTANTGQATAYTVTVEDLTHGTSYSFTARIRMNGNGKAGQAQYTSYIDDYSNDVWYYIG
jgi:hypothetical protein